MADLLLSPKQASYIGIVIDDQLRPKAIDIRAWALLRAGIACSISERHLAALIDTVFSGVDLIHLLRLLETDEGDALMQATEFETAKVAGRMIEL